MTTEEQTESTDLVVLDNVRAAEIFQTEESLDVYLKKAVAFADSFVADTTTAKGRSEITSRASKVVKLKTTLDGMGKDLVSEQKAEIKRVDAIRKHARDTLDELKVRIRQPLTEWEEAEKVRQEKIDEHLNLLRLFIDRPPATVETLNDASGTIDAIEKFDFGDNKTHAEVLIESARKAITHGLAEIERQEELEAERKKREEEQQEQLRLAEEQRKADQAELEELRRKNAEAEAEKQAAIDAKNKAEEEAENAKRQAEEDRILAERKAEDDRLAAEAEEERINQEKIEAAEKASRERAEQARLKREQEKAEAERLETLKSNLAALAKGLEPYCKKGKAELLATAIDDGEISGAISHFDMS